MYLQRQTGLRFGVHQCTWCQEPSPLSQTYFLEPNILDIYRKGHIGLHWPCFHTQCGQWTRSILGMRVISPKRKAIKWLLQQNFQKLTICNRRDTHGETEKINRFAAQSGRKIHGQTYAQTSWPTDVPEDNRRCADKGKWINRGWNYCANHTFRIEVTQIFSFAVYQHFPVFAAATPNNNWTPFLLFPKVDSPIQPPVLTSLFHKRAI